MLTLIKKDSLNFIMSLAMFLTLISVYWLTNKTSIDESMILTNGSYIYLLVFLPIFLNEQQENKDNGYIFLATLPIKTIEIIGSKFLLAFIAVCSLVIYNFALLSFFPGDYELMVIGKAYTILSAIICLVITALMYIGIYALVKNIFITIIPIVFIGMTIIPILVYEFIISKLSLNVEEIVRLFENANWILIIALATVLYFLLMVITAKLKERRGE